MLPPGRGGDLNEHVAGDGSVGGNERAVGLNVQVGASTHRVAHGCDREGHLQCAIVIPSTKSLVRDRLQAEGHLDSPWAPRLLDAIAERAAEQQIHAGAYLKSVTVEGFRGIGPERTLAVTPGPGLTLVVGRNGSGKSSFAEALEVLLTGTSQRWMGRSKVWQDGWRNLHQAHPTAIRAQLVLDDVGDTVVSTSWEPEATFDAATSWVQLKGKPRGPLDTLGWQAALSTYRPFLSYNELGSLLDGEPSKLYDAVSKVLGLDDVVEAQNTLATQRTERERVLKTSDTRRKQLIDSLKTYLTMREDERASSCVAALEAKPWDLAALESLVRGEVSSNAGNTMALVGRAASLEAPSAEQISQVVTALRSAAAALASVAGTDADRARTQADLLTRALDAHTHRGSEDCVVCGTAGVLTPDWVVATRAEIERLRGEATESASAQAASRMALHQAQQCLSPAPAVLEQLAAHKDLNLAGVAEAQMAWKEWAGGRELTDLTELATHLDAHHATLVIALEDLRRAAAVERQRREDVWRPLQLALAQWLTDAFDAQVAVEDVPAIKDAETWLKTAAVTIRNDRFQPIADKVTVAWNHLRQQSNVTLGQIGLIGGKTQRRVELGVTIDGVAGAALGVMSQGELHALALSLFLPRATLDDSPFRFIVVDDPVQSMDPARVDGLARALEDVARTRQVIVFTHDDRLPEAVRRLGIPTTIVGVTRRPKSVVEVRLERDPVEAYLADAFALIKTQDLPDAVKRQVVPGFLRLAIEATCVSMVRRRRLSHGTPHAEVEAAIDACRTTTQKAALALFDDVDKGGDVMRRLNGFGPWAGDAFKQCNQGAHASAEGDMESLARDAQSLVRKLAALA